MPFVAGVGDVQRLGRPLTARIDGEIRTVVGNDVPAEQLHRLQELQALGLLAGGLAHQLSTPLQAVAANVHFVQRACMEVLLPLLRAEAASRRSNVGNDNDHAPHDDRHDVHALDLGFVMDELPRALAQSVEGLSQLAALTQTMKEVVGTQEPAFLPTDVRHLIDRALLIASHRWRYSCRIVRSDDAALPLVHCRADQLLQCVVQLVLNAVEAIEARADIPEGVLEIGARLADDETVVISVHDNGIGASPEVQARMFEPFFTTKDPNRSAGQGLDLARSVAFAHGGRVEVFSEHGVGTRAHVYLSCEPQLSARASGRPG